jgi:NifU-like protein involved in Fe-S cluster formation
MTFPFAQTLLRDRFQKTRCQRGDCMGVQLAAAVILLLLVASGCLALQKLKSGRLRPADGQGRITGRCGESVAIGLCFSAERVVEAAARSDGCAYSCTCALAAARLARGRSAAEILDISAAAIERAAGGVPADHRHCAALAAAALRAAVDDYMQGRRGAVAQQREPAA